VKNMAKGMTIRIPEEMRDSLLKICREENIKASNLIRDSIRRTIAIHQFRRLRSKALKASEKAGFLLDEDIFQKLS
jgi:predicted transcriptional regulator